MAREYTRTKRAARNSTPDFSHRRERDEDEDQEGEDAKMSDQIVLEDDTENAESMLEF